MHLLRTRLRLFGLPIERRQGDTGSHALEELVVDLGRKPVLMADTAQSLGTDTETGGYLLNQRATASVESIA
ncbi:hypothetical protein KDAU_65040 [Dictyobacter aurantiacus]|uniref:Uncharacterized protein n=1 Tax=Dictyobacter aurantiacus TaxID=1936993 RepID=A0A401ZQM5_9CHLR|nr:hypothetical protein KDAU_65040 [Dictyobacter aurantiacus]